jgi:hypothetical protein
MVCDNLRQRHALPIEARACDFVAPHHDTHGADLGAGQTGTAFEHPDTAQRHRCVHDDAKNSSPGTR